MSTFTERLRTCIETRGISQKQLAAETRLSAARLNNYLMGRSEPSFDVLCILCQSLCVSADYLLGLSDNMAPLPAPSSDEEKLSSVLNLEVTRDPLAALYPEQREIVEATIAAMLAQNEKLSSTEKEA